MTQGPPPPAPGSAAPATASPAGPPPGSALAAWAAARGAVPAASDRALTPWARFAEPAREPAAARAGAGLWDLGAWGALSLRGKDPAGFLHKYCTQDLRALAPGGAAFGCALTLKGGLVTDLWALRREDDLLVVTPPAGRAALAEHLRRYALLDRVTLADAGLALVGLVGAQAAAVAARALGAAPPTDPARHASLAWEGRPVLAARPTLAGVEAVLLGVGRDAAPALADALAAAGATPVGAEALDGLRVEVGGGLLGVDLDDGTLPLEAGLEARAISFTKGCYLGQEVVARLAHRGHVNRHLLTLRLEGPPVACPAPLFAEGGAPGARPAATLTTCAATPGGATLGLALVHRKHAAPGTALRVGAPDGPRAVVPAAAASPA